MPPSKLILFDIDGTLLHTGGIGRMAFERAFFDHFGIPDVWQNLRPDGMTDPLIMEEISNRVLNRSLSETERKLIYESYTDYFRKHISGADKFRLMPGIPEILHALNTRDELLLGIQTGNFEEAAWLKLERGGLRGFFRFGGFGSDHHDRTRVVAAAVKRGERVSGKKFRNRDIFVIGDAPQDIHAGNKLGCRTAAVATGSTSGEKLSACLPEILFQDLTDIPRVLDWILK